MLLLKKAEGKLLYYKRLKKVYKCEKDLNILNLDHRRAVTSIIVSDHIFANWKWGWKINIERNERFGTMCDEAKFCNEFHVLM